MTLPAQFFTVDGYAPFSAQMLLLRYWKLHGQPRVLRTVPGQPTNDVFIEARGREAIRIGEKVTTLERFAIDGVVWGRETLWLDERGSLAAAITRAGGLSFEAVREDLEPALVQFVQRATRDRIGDLESITRVNAAAQERDLCDGGRDDRRRHESSSRARRRRARPRRPHRRRRLARRRARSRWGADGRRLWQDARAGTVGHAHPRHADRVGAGLSRFRGDDRPRHGERVRVHHLLRDAIASKRALGPRLLLAGLVDGPGPNAFGVY